MAAFVAGNGNSRKNIDLHQVKKAGMLYGCNALYLDVTPDVLVATDLPMATVIQNSGYALHQTFYTREPFSDKGALKLKFPFWGWSSGPNAVQLAVHDGHKEIYLFGFDFGSVNDKFNNCYAGHALYKKATDTATYGGNWLNQIESIIKHSKLAEFTLVLGDETVFDESVFEYPNFKTMNITDFSIRINNVKDDSV